MKSSINNPLLFLAVLIAAVTLSCGQAIGGAHTPGNLTGRVVLENQSDQFGVKVELRLDAWDLTMITNSAGVFTIPADLSAGDWTVSATFPFFGEADSGFTVTNGFPTSGLPDLVMPRILDFRVTTDAPAYRIGSPVSITLTAENLSTSTVTLRSRTSSMLAYAVTQDGQVVAGSLMPGDLQATQEVTLAAGEQKTFTVEWPTDSVALAPGFYDVYAILAASDTYPDYFSPDAPELNESLYAKLVPAEIQFVQ